MAELPPYDGVTPFSERYNVGRRAVTTTVNPAAGQLLLHATQQADLAACQALITECGASVAFRNGLGENCLHVAAQRGVPSVLELLLRYGADPNTTMETRYGGRTPLHVAVRSGDAKAVSCLLDMQADPNIPDAFMKLPLHDAAALGNVGVVRLLLSKGSVPSVMDKLQCTPLDYAVRAGHSDAAAAIQAAVAARAGDSEESSSHAGPVDLMAAVTSPAAFAAKNQSLATRIYWKEKKPPPKKK